MPDHAVVDYRMACRGMRLLGECLPLPASSVSEGAHYLHLILCEAGVHVNDTLRRLLGNGTQFLSAKEGVAHA
jgi:hypothetical protein